MRDALPHILFAAFVLAMCIATAVFLRMQEKPQKLREQLRKELEAAERSHAKRSHIRKLFVAATCEELRQTGATRLTN